MIPVSAEHYWALCTLAGPWRDGYEPEPHFLLGEGANLPAVTKAIYIACDRARRPLYVGKVSRRTRAAVAARLAEHVRRPARARAWAWLYVIPLKPETPENTVLAIEGAVGRRLGPVGSERLPRGILVP